MKKTNKRKAKGIENAVKAVREFKRFLITSHVNLEGDSLGSQLAMANLLKSLGKEFVIFDHDRVPSHYQFLPNVNRVRNDINRQEKKFDAAIVLDCPNLNRTGKVKEAVKKVGYIINIDHHISNENFGNINWVEKDVSSVGEMIHALYKKIGSPLTKEAALYLYIAILTDTGSFNYSNTSSATHEIVSELLGFGIAPGDISESIYQNKPLGDVKLLGKAISSLKVVFGGKVAYMVIRSNLLKATKTGPASCENFVNVARSVKGVEVAVFFREDMKQKNFFHASFRSNRDADVNKIAGYFGGGGHKKASGCAIKGSLGKVKKMVLGRIKDEL